MLSDRYQDAMLFAAKLHGRHRRKGGEIPYLSHLLGVSGLIMENGGNEDEAIAGLLHDALEDQSQDYQIEDPSQTLRGRPALKHDIETRYGERVLEIVEACTDDETFEKPPEIAAGTVEEWKERKAHYLNHLATFDDAGVLRVSCSDKLHNARCILIDYKEKGEDFWNYFQASNKENQIWYYDHLTDIFTIKARTLNDTGLRRLSSALGVVVENIRNPPFD